MIDNGDRLFITEQPQRFSGLPSMITFCGSVNPSTVQTRAFEDQPQVEVVGRVMLVSVIIIRMAPGRRQLIPLAVCRNSPERRFRSLPNGHSLALQKRATRMRHAATT